jgi:probable phosphoglycerate mutase
MKEIRVKEKRMTVNKPTTILLVRHAEVHNPDGILYGRLPRYGLSELGRRQAGVTARVLAEEPVSLIYTSPQLRARQTAGIIARAHPGIPVRVTALLAEVLTSWQGRPFSDLEKIGFDFYGNPLSEQDETLEKLWHRIEKFVRRTVRRHAGQTVVGVTHGDFIVLARSVYSGLPLSVASMRAPHVYPGHGSITKLTFGPDLPGTYPISVEYYDPNSPDPQWSEGWVRFGPQPQPQPQPLPDDGWRERSSPHHQAG